MGNFGNLALMFACILWSVKADSSVYIGEFRSLAHGVKSGPVYVLDDKTIQITDFYYDGDGPDAWFVIGTDAKYTQEKPRGGLPFKHIVPDENGSCNKPKKYSGKTFELTLPGNVGVTDISYLALYCVEFNHNFGYIKIPRGLQVPLSTRTRWAKSCPRSQKGPNDTTGSGTRRNTFFSRILASFLRLLGL